MAGFFVAWNRLLSGRTTGWTSAESIGDIIGSMALDDGRLWPCSACLIGEYGFRDVSLGVPVALASGKIKEIVEFDLEPSEQQALAASARSVQEMIRDGEALL
jgi:malate dehydrogenase